MASNNDQLAMEDPSYVIAQIEDDGIILPSESACTHEMSGRVYIKRDLGIAKFMSIPVLLRETASKYPNHEALNDKRQSITYQDYMQKVKNVAKAFQHLGLQKHHGVCILGSNSPQWCICYVAAIYAGGVAAGLYTTTSVETWQYCMEISQANIIVVEDEVQAQMISRIRENLPQLKAIVQYDGVAGNDAVNWEQLLTMGKRELEGNLSAINECCTVVFSAEIMKNKKAVLLNHDNIITNTRSIAKRLKVRYGKERFLSFLPLAHISNQIMNIFLPMMTGAKVYFDDGYTITKNNIIKSLNKVHPTIFFAVPYVWELFSIEAQLICRNNKTMTDIISWAKFQGRDRHINNRVTIPSLKYNLSKWLVFNRIKSALGLDRCRVFGSTGAPLGTHIKKYFMSLDIVIIDAYGMSECAGFHSLSTIKDAHTFGSVGYPLSGFATTIRDKYSDGKGVISISGRHVFMGYLNDPEKTKQVKYASNCLLTGDLGKKDEHEKLCVIGKIEDHIITALGRHIDPLPIEERFKQECPVLSNAVLVGNNRIFLTILFTLRTQVDDQSGIPLDDFTMETCRWARCLGSSSIKVTEDLKDEDRIIRWELEKIISRVNNEIVDFAQRIQDFTILSKDFCLSDGTLGPMMKLNRKFIVENNAESINKLYEEHFSDEIFRLLPLFF